MPCVYCGLDHNPAAASIACSANRQASALDRGAAALETLVESREGAGLLGGFLTGMFAADVGRKGHEYALAHEAGRRKERAEIVAWLRMDGQSAMADTLASRIEKGEHRPKPPPLIT